MINLILWHLNLTNDGVNFFLASLAARKRPCVAAHSVYKHKIRGLNHTESEIFEKLSIL